MSRNCKRSARVAQVAVLVFIVCLALPAAARSIPNGNAHQTVDLGGISLEVFTYRPKNCTPSAILLVFHGLHRGVEDNRGDLRPVADELCLVEAVPLFDEGRFPGWRYQKGGIAYHGSLLPPGQWTGNLALRLVDWIRSDEGQPALPYVVIGHSAGAQFLSRFAAFIPNDAKAIVIANPSTHVLASLEVEAPFGFKGVYDREKAEAALRNYLAEPVIMVLGQDDVGDKDRDDEPAARKQGKTRYKRGINTFRAAQSTAAARGWPFRWRLIELPGVGHSTSGVFKSREVTAALREVMAARGEDGGSPPSADSANQPDSSTMNSSNINITVHPAPGPNAQIQDPAGQSAGAGQAPAPQSPSPQDQKPADKAAPSPAAEDASQSKEEVKITPRQAEELFHSVDEILEFDSQQSGLPVKKDVKRKLTSRDEVVSYLTKHVDDEDTKRLRRSELVLKKFGLLPHDFNLETFLVALLREEVAGYYDPKTKTVNLLDWVPIEEQEPVMAHELTHALQDQSIGLEKWMKRGEKDLGEIRKDPTPTDIENDEMDNAREAVIEGQAQAMMFQYALAPTGRSIVTSPELVDAMEDETMTGTPGTKVFNEAPIFMKESLTFPYTYGMQFVIQLMQKGGKQKAFAAVLQNPPHTTRQIMEPETYLSDEKLEPMRVPDFKHDFKEYQKFDIGAMGEFDVAVLIEQYAGKPSSKRLYPEWRGGYYYAAKPKPDSKSDPAPLGLLYVSRWSSPGKAAEFAEIYAQSLKQRYKKAQEVGDAVSDNARKSEASVDLLQGRHAWTTEEGAVVIEEQGDTVFVSESLDAATTATLEREVFPAPPVTPSAAPPAAR
jgi:hypothetical protein